MIHIATGNDITLYKNELEQAYMLRHRVFVDEMKWEDLRKPDGREIDEFDDDHAVHMFSVKNGAVLGYQRMLPTTRPYLLTNILPELCETDFPNSPQVWEWTRYCVEKEHRERGRVLSPIANELLSGIVEWGIGNNVTSIVIEMEPIWILRLVQLHFKVTPLGIPKIVGSRDCLAVQAAFDQRTLRKLQEMSGGTASVLSQEGKKLVFAG